MTEKEILYHIKELLEDSRERLTRIEDKLGGHAEKIARVEEQQKGAKGAITILFSLFTSALGWAIYKARF